MYMHVMDVILKLALCDGGGGLFFKSSGADTEYMHEL